VNFTLDNVDAVLTANGNIVAMSAGAPSGGTFAGHFDWGLPFFFGRNVFTAIEGAPYGSGPGPYFAY
jgi:hypothetical protein